MPPLEPFNAVYMKAYQRLADEKSLRRFNLVTDRELCTVEVSKEDLPWFGKTWFRQTREAYLREGHDKRLVYTEQPADLNDELSRIVPKQRKAKAKTCAVYRSKLRPRANGKAIVVEKAKPKTEVISVEEAEEFLTVTPEDAYEEAKKLDVVEQHIIISTQGNPRTVCGYTGFEI